jgi:hypothetical protein
MDNKLKLKWLKGLIILLIVVLLMNYICDLSKEELALLDADQCRSELYKFNRNKEIRDEINEVSYNKIKTHLSNHGLVNKFSQFLEEYKREINIIKREKEADIRAVIYKKKEEEEKIKKEEERKIEEENKKKNSLKYWMDEYPERFKNGTFEVHGLCYSTYPCCHHSQLVYEDEKGEKQFKSFSSYQGGGRTLLEVIKMSGNSKWSDHEIFGRKMEDVETPLQHFSAYEKKDSLHGSSQPVKNETIKV